MRTSGSLSPRVPRVPSLDGLRAVSIMLVLMAHLAGTKGFPLSAYAVLGLADIGRLGVRIFFVISGFLITGLLIHELKATGRLDLVAFFMKRTFRIFPAYYTYVVTIAIAASLGWVTLNPGDLLHAFTYTMNYHPGQSWIVGHAWTLSVEEQFYLLWPVMIILAGLPGAFRAAAMFLIVASFVRLLLYLLPKEFTGRMTDITGQSFETVGDAIATGCLLSALRERMWANTPWRSFLSGPAFWLVPVVVLIAAIGDRMVVYSLQQDQQKNASIALLHFLSIPIMNIGIAVCIEGMVRFPTGWTGRLLNHPVLVHIGALSYSLYLWQQPFLNRRESTWYTAFPVNIILAAAAAYASYYLVERPVLRLRPVIIQRFLHRRPVESVVEIETSPGQGALLGDSALRGVDSDYNSARGGGEELER